MKEVTQQRALLFTFFHFADLKKTKRKNFSKNMRGGYEWNYLWTYNDRKGKSWQSNKLPCPVLRNISDKWQIHDCCIYGKHLDRKEFFFEFTILFFECVEKNGEVKYSRKIKNKNRNVSHQPVWVPSYNFERKKKSFFHFGLK